MLQARDRVSNKLPGGEGAGGAGQQPAEYVPECSHLTKKANGILACTKNMCPEGLGRFFPSVLGTGEPTP